MGWRRFARWHDHGGFCERTDVGAESGAEFQHLVVGIEHGVELWGDARLCGWRADDHGGGGGNPENGFGRVHDGPEHGSDWVVVVRESDLRERFCGRHDAAHGCHEHLGSGDVDACGGECGGWGDDFRNVDGYGLDAVEFGEIGIEHGDIERCGDDFGWGDGVGWDVEFDGSFDVGGSGDGVGWDVECGSEHDVFRSDRFVWWRDDIGWSEHVHGDADAERRYVELEQQWGFGHGNVGSDGSVDDRGEWGADDVECFEFGG